ncbi:hypothetical protein [Deinococcus ruber]|uniref:Gp5/Type VI secretion system Vgr protein OB-fold domain-containing protein n=1 Tax=Deinococcus ruber TaxID=1848197 RepID=A0A918C135_9DEIO|nr:hypothetical protein [Deinococcus ruber]GGR00323.1 hypothetical protein GCM10008957_11370 [Deinococcus ruber]
MAYLNVSGVPAGQPSVLTLPLQGRPWADVTLAARAVPFKQYDGVQVALQDGETYSMTVERIGVKGGFTSAYLVGGTGGLSKEIGPKFYRQIPAKKVLEELLTDCGEVAGDIDLPGTLPAWVRGAGPAHEALRALMMRYPERVWRMRPSGQIDVGVPSWPEQDGTQQILHEDAAAGTFAVGLDPKLLPGRLITFSRGEDEFSKRATRVSHSLTEVYGYPRMQTVLRSYIGTGDGEDLGISGLETTIQRAVRWTDYLALYDCEVLRDHGDHTLDLRPSNPQIPELTRVRMVQPIAGARVKFRAGSVVLLSFQAGDPSRPVVLHYGTATLERLEIATGKGQLFQMDDDRGEVSPEDQLYKRPNIRMQDYAGQFIELWAEPGQERIQVQDRAGSLVKLDGKGNIGLTASVHVEIDAPTVGLAGPGGTPVALLNCMVTVPGVMPGAATVIGTISSASTRVTSG